MVERNSFETVTDGDQLNDGYFNGILSKFNTNQNQALTLQTHNLIRQLIDRDVDFDGRGGEWAEGYFSNDQNGRKNSISLADTTALQIYTTIFIYLYCFYLKCSSKENSVGGIIPSTIKTCNVL